MGLDTSHDCWHGAYGAFMKWRMKIAEVAGLPPLMLMEGFYDPDRYGDSLEDRWYLKGLLPISWDCLKDDPIHELLYHSDCDGEIPWESCAGIADSLEKLMPLLPHEDVGGHIGYWEDKTQQFIDGLRLAASKKENVDFH